MEIEWKAIPAAPDYSVSNTGLVRSEARVITMKNGRQRTIHQKILKPRTCGAGYLQVDLGQLRGCYIHRLVAENFISEWKQGFEINHIDENKKNNAANNLEWATHLENVMHGTRNKRCSADAMKRKKAVVAKKNGEIIKRFDSIHAAEREGYQRRGIQLCCAGKLLSYKGYEWEAVLK